VDELHVTLHESCSGTRGLSEGFHGVEEGHVTEVSAVMMLAGMVMVMVVVLAGMVMVEVLADMVMVMVLAGMVMVMVVVVVALDLGEVVAVDVL